MAFQRCASATASTARTVTGVSRLVPASSSGLGFDYYHHEVAVGGLSAATAYTYDATLGSAAVMSAGFRTAPATGTGDTTFIVFGDSGTGSTQQRQLATLMSNDTFDVALHAGDIVYGFSNGTGDASYKTYNDWFFDIYAPWLPFRAFYPPRATTTAGRKRRRRRVSRRVHTADQRASSSYPDHSERYYSFDYGRVHFVALDSEFAFQDVTRRAEQLSWLESDLAATRQPWKVALFHRSPYSAGGEHGSDLAVRAAFSPVFERYGVQLSLSAHEHTYERTHPLRESATGTAVTYIVAGGGGAPLYPAGTADWTAFTASRHHYVKGLVTDCTITLTAIGLDGRTFDGTTINRCVQPPPPSAAEVVRYASDVAPAGRWVLEADGTAAGGQRVRHSDAGAAKITTAAGAAGQLLRRDVRRRRRRALSAVDSRQGRQQRLGERLGVRAVRQERERERRRAVPHRHDRRRRSEHRGLQRMRPVGMGLAGQRLGVGVRGPLIYFAGDGVQRLRIQTREDGLSIDQIVLSPDRYLTASPGALKNDNTILIRP
jgi:hypothetical protein